MKKFARIENDLVVETLQAEELPEFHKSLIWIEVGADAQPGWVHTAGTVSAPPPPSLESLKARKIEALALKRWMVEAGGITVNGAVIATDDRSQSKVTGALMKVTRNPATLIDWKGENGWIKIAKAEVEAIADLVGDHVQACFSRECALAEAIAAAEDVAALEAIDINSGWPA